MSPPICDHCGVETGIVVRTDTGWDCMNCDRFEPRPSLFRRLFRRG